MTPHPRLARGVTITRRQVGEDEVFYLVKDPRGGSFLRMGEAEAAVLRLLDGTRSPAEVARQLALAHGIQVETAVVDGFVASLTHRGMVESRAFDPVAFRREWRLQEEARRRTLGKLVGSVAALKVRLLNPQALFERMVGPLGFCWTRRFVLWTLVLMVAAAAVAVANAREILASSLAFYHEATDSTGSLATHALLVYGVLFVVVAVHESAHGLTCVHFGGKVTDMGFILFYLQIPGFYCDITDAYGFERRSDRLWTTIAGGYTGLVLASLGVFLWWVTDPGDLLNRASVAIMFLGGPPLLILNWNPLIRYDGYYILIDLLEAPNLMTNSRRYLGYLLKARLLRVPAEPMPVPLRLRRTYIAYGIASQCFLAPLMATMPLIVYYLFVDIAGEWVATAVAALFAYRVLKQPAMTAFTTLRYAWLTHRGAPGAGAAAQAGGTRLALAGGGALIALVLGIVGPRFAVHAHGDGVLEPLEHMEVRANEPGFVPAQAAAGLALEGQRVEAGDLLVRLDSPELEAQRREATSLVRGLRLEVTALEARGEPSAAAVRRGAQRSATDRESLLARRVEGLSLLSPIAGVVLTPRLDQRAGEYLDRGEIWCSVGRDDRLRVRVPLGEKELGLIAESRPARIQAPHLPGEVFEGRVSRLPAGRRPQAPPPFQVAGAAPVAARPADDAEAGGSLLVEVEVDNAGRLLVPGMAVKVRILGERLTLAGHTARWARRLFKGKLWW